METSLVAFMPGSSRNSHPHQQAISLVFKAEGIAAKDGLQINSFLNGRDGFPDRVDPSDVGAADAMRRCLWRDWMRSEPVLAYWDYEPHYIDPVTLRRVAFPWIGHRDGFTDEAINLAHAAADEIKAANPSLPLGIWGIPILPSAGVPFFRMERYRMDDMQRIVKPFDYVLAGFYADKPIQEFGSFDEARERMRIRTGLAAARLFGKPVVPILRFTPWPIAGDEEQFARVVFEELAAAQVETVAIWDNPKDAAHEQYVAERIRIAAPYIRDFLKR